MASDWAFDFPLDDAERELALRRIREALRVVAVEPLAGLLKAFEAQVAAGTARIRLPVAGLDLIQKIHWSHLLQGLSTGTGYVSCRACSGAGTVALPRPLVNLQAVFDYAYNLTLMGEPDRWIYLEQPCDPAVRERIKAEQHAEAERKRDALRRSEAASYGVLPGTARSEMVVEQPEEQPEGRPDFVPARRR